MERFEVGRWKEIFGIADADLEILPILNSVAEQRFDEWLREFFAFVERYPGIALAFATGRTREEAASLVRRHFLAAFTGPFDADEWLRTREELVNGLNHLALQPWHYCGAVAAFHSVALRSYIEELNSHSVSVRHQALACLDRLMLMDIAWLWQANRSAIEGELRSKIADLEPFETLSRRQHQELENAFALVARQAACSRAVGHVIESVTMPISGGERIARALRKVVEETGLAVVEFWEVRSDSLNRVAYYPQHDGLNVPFVEELIRRAVGERRPVIMADGQELSAEAMASRGPTVSFVAAVPADVGGGRSGVVYVRTHEGESWDNDIRRLLEQTALLLGASTRFPTEPDRS